MAGGGSRSRAGRRLRRRGTPASRSVGRGRSASPTRAGQGPRAGRRAKRKPEGTSGYGRRRGPGRRRSLLLALGPFLGVALLGDVPLAALLQGGGPLGVQRGEAGPLGRHVGLGEDRLYGALRHARLAVDAVRR